MRDLPVLRLGLPPWLQCIAFRFDSPLLHHVAHEVDPLPVPRENPRPNLKGLVRLDFLAKGTGHAAQHDPELPFPLIDDFRTGLVHAQTHETAEMVHSGHIEITKVSAVGLVNIVITLQHRGARRGDNGLEQSGTRACWRMESARANVAEKPTEKADLQYSMIITLRVKGSWGNLHAMQTEDSSDSGAQRKEQGDVILFSLGSPRRDSVG